MRMLNGLLIVVILKIYACQWQTDINVFSPFSSEIPHTLMMIMNVDQVNKYCNCALGTNDHRSRQ